MESFQISHGNGLTMTKEVIITKVFILYALYLLVYLCRPVICYRWRLWLVQGRTIYLIHPLFTFVGWDKLWRLSICKLWRFLHWVIIQVNPLFILMDWLILNLFDHLSFQILNPTLFYQFILSFKVNVSQVSAFIHSHLFDSSSEDHCVWYFRQPREWDGLLLDHRLMPGDGEAGKEQAPLRGHKSCSCHSICTPYLGVVWGHIFVQESLHCILVIEILTES